MFIDSNEMNRTDIFSSSILYYDENKQYFNTTIKKKKNSKYSNSNNENILLNSLKNYSVKYELENQEIPKSYKYVITFDELISLIRFTLESQIKIDQSLKNDSENLTNLSKEFINNLSYYIYSYEKVEKITQEIKSKKKFKSPSDKENISINSNIRKTKKPIKLMNKSSSSYWVNTKKSKNNEIKRKEEKNEKQNKKSKNISENNGIQTSKSYYRRNLGPKLFSPEKNKIKGKNKNENKKSLLNRSVEKRHNTLLSDFSTNTRDSSVKKRLNKSTERRKNVKEDKNRNENKSISIYTACENMKSSSFILKCNKNKESVFTEQGEKRKIKKSGNNYDSNNNIDFNKRKDNKKIIYYNQNMMLGVRKQIINSNVPKPSSLANKLLQNGRKFITEFNGIKEEERKKLYY